MENKLVPQTITVIPLNKEFLGEHQDTACGITIIGELSHQVMTDPLKLAQIIKPDSDPKPNKSSKKEWK